MPRGRSIEVGTGSDHVSWKAPEQNFPQGSENDPADLDRGNIDGQPRMTSENKGVRHRMEKKSGLPS